MSRGLHLPLVSAYLIALAAGAVWTAESAWKSVTAFAPTHSIAERLPPGAPVTNRLVLIVTDGLRTDMAHALPNWSALAARGASGVVEAPDPSLSNPARATMTTGARPEIHGVTTNGFDNPPPVESVLSAAKRVNVPVATFASDFWRRAYADSITDRAEFEKELHVVDNPQELVDWQNETCDRMVPFLARQNRGLLVAGLTAGDSAGHDFGGDSDGYRLVQTAVDACLGRIVDALDDGRTTFFVISDHGHIHRRGFGGHGGREPEVIDSPFTLAGPGAARAKNLNGDMRDVASTIALLLGLPIPANNQGEPIWGAIGRQLQWEEQVAAQHALERARVPRREDAIAEEQAARRVAGVGLILIFSLIAFGSAWVSREPRARFLAALALFFLLYAALFWAFGLAYSLSAIIREEYTNSFFARDIAAAALALVAARLLISGDSPAERCRRRAWLAASAASLFALRAAWIYLQTGLFAAQTLPDLAAAFQAYLDLLAAVGVALAGLLATGASLLLSRRRPART